MASGMFVGVLLKICEFRGSQYREDGTFVVDVHVFTLKGVP